jgi:hypothetical protein
MLGTLAAIPAIAGYSQKERAALMRAFGEEVRPPIAAYRDREAVTDPMEKDIAIACK